MIGTKEITFFSESFPEGKSFNLAKGNNTMEKAEEIFYHLSCMGEKPVSFQKPKEKVKVFPTVMALKIFLDGEVPRKFPSYYRKGKSNSCRDRLFHMGSRGSGVRA